MNFRKNSKGITLVALVVTIIILLILAGVSIALISGGNGILGKATKAVDETTRGSAKEETELMVSDTVAQFYEDVYVEGDTDLKVAGVNKYIKDNVNGKQTNSGNYYVTIGEDNKVTVYSGEDSTGLEIATGTLEENGKLVWSDSALGSTTGGEGSSGGSTGGNNSGSTENGENASGDNSEAVDGKSKIKLACSTVNYVTPESNGIKITVNTTDTYETIEYYVNDKLVYTSEDGTEKTYLVTEINGKPLELNKDYKIYVYGCRTDEELTTIASLNNKMSSQITSANVGEYIDFGTNYLTEEQKTTYPYDWRILKVENDKVHVILSDYLPEEHIPTGTNISKTGYRVYASSSRNYLINYLKDTTIWNSFTNGIEGATAVGGLDYYVIKSYGFTNNSLFIPHTSSWNSTEGYWLTTTVGYGSVQLVEYSGLKNAYGVYDTNYKDEKYGVRPVVSLPSNISVVKDGDVWRVQM